MTRQTQTEQVAAPEGELSDDWRAVAEAIPQQVWSARPDGLIDYSSQRVFEFTGTLPSPADGDGWLELVHPEDRARLKAQWQHSITTGEPYEIECRLRHRSGECRWVLVQAKPARDPEGRIMRWFGTSADIHAAKTIEAALARREEQHRALLEASSVVLWVATPDGMITETTGWEEITGQDGTEASGLGSFDVVHPDDFARVSQAWQYAVVAGVAYEAECRIRQQNGDYRWMLTKAVPIRNPDGSLREWVGGLSDIHDRKQAEEQLRASEERLRLALHAGRMVAWELDLTTNFITLSQNATKLLGVGSGLLSTFLARIPDVDQTWRDDFALRMTQDGEDTIEFRYQRPDGTLLWLGSRAKKASPNTVVGVTFDITDRKAAEEAAWRTMIR